MNIFVNANKENKYFVKRLREVFNDNKEIKLIFSYKNDNLKWEDIDVLITKKNITEEELKKATNLKVLYFFYTGINHLPLKLIKDRKITLINTHAHAPVVALRALTLGLTLLGRVAELHEQLKKGIWKGHNGNSTWQAIYNLRCGMIGMGEIGKEIVNLLQPFNVTLITLNRYKKSENSSKFTY